jgi:choline dehydrogenase-like flavoprotein
MVPPGESIHELGTCRMGANPKTSVLNAHNQSHDVKNLFVVDGSSFTSGGVQNPTLTILALSMRAGEYIIDQRKKGAL